jgi:hypothetical protein
VSQVTGDAPGAFTFSFTTVAAYVAGDKVTVTLTGGNVFGFARTAAIAKGAVTGVAACKKGATGEVDDVAIGDSSVKVTHATSGLVLEYTLGTTCTIAATTKVTIKFSGVTKVLPAAATVTSSIQSTKDVTPFTNATYTITAAVCFCFSNVTKPTNAQHPFHFF